MTTNERPGLTIHVQLPSDLIDGVVEIAKMVGPMLDFAEKAGGLALSERAKGLEVTHKTVGDTIDLGQALTQADTAISQMMLQAFSPIIEEETAKPGYTNAAAMLDKDSLSYIGDPIDGTKPYAGGLAGWGTMLAACKGGEVVAGVVALPAWVDERDQPFKPKRPRDQRGLLLAAFGGKAYYARLRGGKMRSRLMEVPRPTRPSYHTGWLAHSINRNRLDFRAGLFPSCESAWCSDAALCVTGRQDTTVFTHKLWDLAPTLPILEASGFRFYKRGTLEPRPKRIIEMFGPNYEALDDWLVCRDDETARKLNAAIR